MAGYGCSGDDETRVLPRSTDAGTDSSGGGRDASKERGAEDARDSSNASDVADTSMSFDASDAATDNDVGDASAGDAASDGAQSDAPDGSMANEAGEGGDADAADADAGVADAGEDAGGGALWVPIRSATTVSTPWGLEFYTGYSANGGDPAPQTVHFSNLRIVSSSSP